MSAQAEPEENASQLVGHLVASSVEVVEDEVALRVLAAWWRVLQSTGDAVVKERPVRWYRTELLLGHHVVLDALTRSLELVSNHFVSINLDFGVQELFISVTSNIESRTSNEILETDKFWYFQNFEDRIWNFIQKRIRKGPKYNRTIKRKA